jgi:hypothetical protein
MANYKAKRRRKTDIITRYEKLTYDEFESLSKDEKQKVYGEYIEELRRRGDYNENATETFFELLGKACRPIKS